MCPLAVGERVSIPAFHHVGTRSDVRVCIQPGLTVAGRILILGVPADGLRVGLRHQVIARLERAAVIAGEAGGFAALALLRIVIRVHGHDVLGTGDVPFVGVRPRRASEVLSDKLVGPFVLIDDSSLPVQEVRGEPPLVAPDSSFQPRLLIRSRGGTSDQSYGRWPQ
jgi:hypothetical protein